MGGGGGGGGGWPPRSYDPVILDRVRTLTAIKALDQPLRIIELEIFAWLFHLFSKAVLFFSKSHLLFPIKKNHQEISSGKGIT